MSSTNDTTDTTATDSEWSLNQTILIVIIGILVTGGHHPGGVLQLGQPASVRQQSLRDTAWAEQPAPSLSTAAIHTIRQMAMGSIRSENATGYGLGACQAFGEKCPIEGGVAIMGRSKIKEGENENWLSCGISKRDRWILYTRHLPFILIQRVQS
jgi:hypothetical protein